MSYLGERFTVDTMAKDCSCRFWSLTGIPCRHAIAAMNQVGLKPENYIPVYYRKQSYAAVYEKGLKPVNGENLWRETEYFDILPPTIKRQPGCPKKVRNKEAGELERDGTWLGRKGYKIKCKNCGVEGHNKSGCNLPPREATETEGPTAHEAAATEAPPA